MCRVHKVINVYLGGLRTFQTDECPTLLSDIHNVFTSNLCLVLISHSLSLKTLSWLSHQFDISPTYGKHIVCCRNMEILWFAKHFCNSSVRYGNDILQMVSGALICSICMLFFLGISIWVFIEKFSKPNGHQTKLSLFLSLLVQVKKVLCESPQLVCAKIHWKSLTLIDMKNFYAKSHCRSFKSTWIWAFAVDIWIS